MSAYDSARLDDLCQRKAKEETLTPHELSLFERLCRQSQTEEDNRPQPFQYGGDMVDIF